MQATASLLDIVIPCHIPIHLLYFYGSWVTYEDPAKKMCSTVSHCAWLLVCCQIINPQNDTPSFQMPLPTRSCSHYSSDGKRKFTKTIPHLIYIIFQHLPFSCARYYMILPFMLCCDILHGNPPWWRKSCLCLCWKGIFFLAFHVNQCFQQYLQIYNCLKRLLASVHDFAGYARLFFDGQLSLGIV